jgi:hypothetical protein
MPVNYENSSHFEKSRQGGQAGHSRHRCRSLRISAALLAAVRGELTAPSDLPDGRRPRNPVQPSCEKYFASVFQNYVVALSPSRLDEEGRYGQSSRNVGRDAVDATVSCAHEVAGRRES